MDELILNGYRGPKITVISNHDPKNVKYIVFRGKIENTPKHLQIPFKDICAWVDMFLRQETCTNYHKYVWFKFPSGDYQLRILDCNYIEPEGGKFDDVPKLVVTMIVTSGPYRGFKTVFQIKIRVDEKSKEVSKYLRDFLTACFPNGKAININKLKEKNVTESFKGKVLKATKTEVVKYTNFSDWKLIHESSAIDDELNDVDGLEDLSFKGDTENGDKLDATDALDDEKNEDDFLDVEED